MKLRVFLLVFFNLPIFYYLSLPLPKLIDLPDSVKSTEPGDTVQISNVSGYYTNLNRQAVISFYRSLVQHPLSYILNHPPEKAKQIIRDTTQSYYLEEIVIPFKQSIFINGFEWQNDVFTKPEKRIANKLIYNGQTYLSKITIRTFTAGPIQQLLSIFFVELSLIIGFYSYRRVFCSLK